jgi:hypothetical protein
MPNSAFFLCASLLLCSAVSASPANAAALHHLNELSADKIVAAFQRQGISINKAEAAGIRANVQLAVKEARAHGIGNSKVDFSAIEIANDLSIGTDSASIRRVVCAIGELLPPGPRPPIRRPPAPPRPGPLWENYFDETVNLWRQSDFMGLMRKNQFFPVKISWEDIGRHQGSVWGDRISDVGIWVRKHEDDPSSARLALSVRRDNNFRDKVLMVPAEKIKVHTKQGNKTVEKTLPQRLAELGLSTPNRDNNVIVSNQFAIVPVPPHETNAKRAGGTPPRTAFNFSIYPYGSTNYVITDVIEGSSEAIVGPGSHQLLFANVGGQKAPFTASRAEDRQDLLKLEKELKAQGMDVDVQRYYLIQIPLRRDARNIVLSNMGTPPRDRPAAYPTIDYSKALAAYKESPVPPPIMLEEVEADYAPTPIPMEMAVKHFSGAAKKNEPGLGRVAIGSGEPEGPYNAGSGHRGARADEPIRVTVVYFVTPKGRVTDADMQGFAKAFSQWDGQAIWGGSFVTKE